MSLIILLSADDFGFASRWLDEASGEEGSNVALEELAERRTSDPKLSVCLALPGEVAVTRNFSLPMKSARDARRAADLLIDDVLASPMDDRVVAMSAVAEGKRLTSAVPAGVLAEALAAAQAAGLDPDIVTVDHALLPVPDGVAVTALRLDDRVAMRTDEGAFTSEAGFAQDLFAGLEDEPLREVQPSSLSSSGVPNFRTGRFAKREPLPDVKPFALAASLALIAGAIFLVASLVEGVRYAGAAGAMRAEAEENFRRAFPGTPIVDMQRQIAGRANAAEGSDFLQLTAILAELIAEQDTTTLSSLTYTAAGELTAELTVVSFPDLEAITEELGARGVMVQEGGDVRREDGALVARLFLRSV